MHKEEEAETLAYFKRELLKHLNTLKDEKETHTERLEKAIFALSLIKSGYPVGTVRTWRGTKFKKIAPNKWRRIYDSETRGAKMSIARLKKQVEKCKSTKELLDLVLQNKSRFMDENGKPLPIVKELSAYAKEKGREKIKVRAEKTQGLRNHFAVQDEQKIETEKEFTPELKQRAISAINNPTEKINYVDYTRENYNKLFPRGECETPIGKVKLGERQFERLAGKDGGTRTKFMGALQQCLQRPDVIIGKTDNKNRYSKLYLKAFLDNNGKKSYLAVVPTIDGVDVVVSNSPRDTKDIAKEIKKAGLCYYIRPALTSSSKRGGSRMENSSVGLTSNNSRNEEVRPSNDSSIAENANSVNEELSLDEKMAKYKKQGKKIVKDERGLYFYEGMTTKEKIEWISQEIKNLSERNELLKKPTHPKPWSRDRLHTETMRYYSNGGDEKKLGAYLTRLEKQEQKLNAQLTKEEIKENESEIAQYKDDLVYYKSVL